MTGSTCAYVPTNLQHVGRSRKARADRVALFHASLRDVVEGATIAKAACDLVNRAPHRQSVVDAIVERLFVSFCCEFACVACVGMSRCGAVTIA